jgi:histidyl-tRNA synthetase
MTKPTIPAGTRDLSPTEVYKRQYIFDTIRSVFELFGYQPVETPTMENLTTLEGKYGDEGDRLLYRVLDSGDWVEGLKKKIFPDTDLLHWTTAKITRYAAEKGLRYDLTVPFARYVVMHQHEITFPFRRYQIQPVFRADRPQRGRYREFYQCDADVVGSDSLINEAEFAQIYDRVFDQLALKVKVKINNRKILQGMAETAEAASYFTDITMAIDKLDKIGLQGVRQELTHRGLSESQLQVIEKFFSMEGNNEEKISRASQLLEGSDTGSKGCRELREMMGFIQALGGMKNELTVDFTLARGLNYYTGAIYEVVSTESSLKSSIGGGGRYDDLTGVFGLKGVSGVGISFGADRIFDVMEELKLFPQSASKGTQVLICYFDEESQQYALPLLKKLRDEKILAEIYPSVEKMKKQLKYANDKKLPYVIVVGENEMKSGRLAFKTMDSGEQREMSIEEIIAALK